MVTLVEFVVENPTRTAVNVRIEDRLGEVWPPRREGIPEAGWDGRGFEAVVGAGERVAVGYASPESPTEPPVEVVRAERTNADDAPDAAGRTEVAVRADGAEHADVVGSVEGTRRRDGAEVSEVLPGDVEPTVGGVVRALGDPRPPADAVPLPAVGEGSERDSFVDAPTKAASTADASVGGAAARAAAPLRHETPRPDEVTPRPDEFESRPTGTASRPEATESRPDGTELPDEAPLPESVESWLAAVEERVERRATLADARSLSDAATAVDGLGGLTGAEDLVAQTRTDREALRALAARATGLAEHADADVPLAAFRRLS